MLTIEASEKINTVIGILEKIITRKKEQNPCPDCGGKIQILSEDTRFC